MKALAASLAVALFAAAPALAEVTDEALEGRWAFEAEAFHGSGVTQEIGGEMEMTRTGPNTYRCSLDVLDRIPDFDVVIRTRQECTATRDGDTLTIESVVVEIDPVGFNYIPDDFTLTIVSGDRMEGVIHAAGEVEAGDEMPGAIFTRGGALLS